MEPTDANDRGGASSPQGGQGAGGGRRGQGEKGGGARNFQAPRGTRDFYPEEMARRRYVFDAWRTTALRHGFDEIDGPTFEHLDLYTVKSGEGIVSELFSFRRAGGETDFALRPEFTPTLARMVAAKANALAKPIKWFSVGSYFRAERPQRGRLREFSQWNCDILGDASPEADAECIACCVEGLRAVGLTERDVVVQYSNRRLFEASLLHFGIPAAQIPSWFGWVDQYDKRDSQFRLESALAFGATVQQIRDVEALWKGTERHAAEDARLQLEAAGKVDKLAAADEDVRRFLATEVPDVFIHQREFEEHLVEAGIGAWCRVEPRIVRGLAYYTGLVFEVHERTGAERAIAGGGRYDNLVELFGGPPTPAVGFAMGDVVLSLVLQDRGLMPEGKGLLGAIGARPDVFLISTGKDESEAALRPLAARLRRGDAERNVPALHVRRTHRTTRNVGKLLKEAADSGARFAVIVESATMFTVKNLDTGEERKDVGAEELRPVMRAMERDGV